MRKAAAEIAMLLVLAAAPSYAAGVEGVTVTDAWLRALPAGVPAAGYFTLHNGTAKPVTLESASSPACGALMLHESMNMGGMQSMEMVASVAAAPGKDVRFAPGGFHLMCMKPALKAGGSVPVTLIFAGGGKVTVNFAVKDARGK